MGWQLQTQTVREMPSATAQETQFREEVHQAHLQLQMALAQQQAGEWYMSSQKYINLNPTITLGTVVVQNRVDQASPWHTANVSRIAETIDHLQHGQPVNRATLDTATQFTSQGLDNLNYAPAAAKTLKQLYYVSPDAPTQARVVGNLLTQSARTTLDEVLKQPDARNHFGAQLGAKAADRLLAITSLERAPTQQNALLLVFAQGALRPPDHPRETAFEAIQRLNTIALDGHHPNQHMIDAVRAGDSDRIAHLLAASSDHAALAQSLAPLGQSLAGPLDDLIVDKNSHVRNFALQTIRAMSAQPMVRAIDPGDMGGSGTIDPQALKEMLLEPSSMPSSLARRFGPTRRIQPVILETIAIFGRR